MRIVVPIKQVPETSAVRMDPETGTIVRDGAEAVVNPLDLYAIETALRLREDHGGEVVAITMGPSRAESAVREAIAMGCDDGILVSDRAFGGADTWATSYVLAQAIRSLGECDLIICGERATDGDTGQVGPGIASWLDLPVITYAARLVLTRTGQTDALSLRAERLVETGYQIVSTRLPALVTVVKEIGEPRLPTLTGKKRARRAKVNVLTRDSLDLEPGYLGLRGSPTKVVRIRTPQVTRGGRTIYAADDPAAAAAGIVSFLREHDLIGGDA